MKQYLHKLLIASVAVLTLGVISPSHEIWSALQHKDDTRAADQPDRNELKIGLGSGYFDNDFAHAGLSVEEQLLKPAKEQAYEKFGTKIGPVIQNEFDAVIFPKIEEVIQETVRHSDRRTLSITAKPSGDYAERIFHVTDLTDGTDLIRFHVRTEKRPLDGYFYNFHYHTAEDGFSRHHSIGDIFWSKNTPPKWLS